MVWIHIIHVKVKVNKSKKRGYPSILGSLEINFRDSVYASKQPDVTARKIYLIIIILLRENCRESFSQRARSMNILIGEGKAYYEVRTWTTC